MKIIAWACVCPVCRFTFTAYLSDRWQPRRDEVAHDKRRLLCNVCDRAFLNTLHDILGEGVTKHGRSSLHELCLSAMQQEAHRTSEPGTQATAGTDNPHSVPDGMQGVSYPDRDEVFSDRVSGPMEPSD